MARPVAALAALLLVSCGGSSSSGSVEPMGVVTTQGADDSVGGIAPVIDVNTTVASSGAMTVWLHWTDEDTPEKSNGFRTWKVHFGQTSGSYIDDANAGESNRKISRLDPGPWYFAVEDYTGHRSAEAGFMRLEEGGVTALDSSPPDPPPPADLTITLEWDAPTHNTDGTDLADLAGYRLYQGVESGELMLAVTLPSSQTQTQVTLPPGQHVFAVTAFDFSQNESLRSNELEITNP
jgi:hypothetical protein